MLQTFLDSEEGQLVASDPGLTPRQRNKRKKGLPEVKNLRVLARTWLEQAHKLYLDLAKADIVPEVSEKSVERMVAAFIKRFVSSEPTPFEVRLDPEAYDGVAAVYCRYSDDNSNSWTGSHISKLMANPMYAGTQIYKRTRTIWDTETGEFSREPNPESEWVIRDAPELRIIDETLWERLRARADEISSAAPRTGKKLNRDGKAMPECQINDLYPTTIVNGVLFCSYCGREMRLVHSSTRHKQLACPNGSKHINGCKLHNSKSLNQITAGLFGYINQHVLTEERMADLVAKANAYLAEEAAKPRIDLKPLKQALANAKKEAKENIEFVRQHRNAFDMTVYLKIGEELNKKIADLQQQLREAEAANAAPPPPIKLEDVLAYLEDLRGLLDQSVESSAHAMRALLGKVMVEEAEIPGRKRKA